MIKHNFLLWGIIELKLNSRLQVCWDTKTLSGVIKITSKPLANASGGGGEFDHKLKSSTLEGFGIST
jgi:hypothetical protein